MVSVEAELTFAKVVFLWPSFGHVVYSFLLDWEIGLPTPHINQTAKGKQDRGLRSHNRRRPRRRNCGRCGLRPANLPAFSAVLEGGKHLE